MSDVALVDPTQPLGDVESVVEAMASALRSTSFTDILAAIDARLDQGQELPRATPGPAAVYGYERATPEAYPCAEVVIVQSEIDEDADEAKSTHRITIDWTVVGDDEEVVTRDVQRLVLATRLGFRRGVLDGMRAIGPMTIQFEDYSRLEQGRDHPLLKGGRVMFSPVTYGQ